MLTDNRADYRTQDWFLIACEGDLVLKLAQDLMIGEDERGQTVLSPAREDALLRITSEHGCLTLQAMAMDWTFSEDGGLSVQHLTFVEGLTLKLCIDTAHLILNREDVVAAVQAARPWMSDFHFCNAVPDTAEPLFGDRHLPFGPPGVVDVGVIAGIMKAFAASGYLSSANRPRIFCEVMTQEGGEPEATVAHCQDALEKAWAQATGGSA